MTAIEFSKIRNSQEGIKVELFERLHDVRIKFVHCELINSRLGKSKAFHDYLMTYVRLYLFHVE